MIRDVEKRNQTRFVGQLRATVAVAAAGFAVVSLEVPQVDE